MESGFTGGAQSGSQSREGSEHTGWPWGILQGNLRVGGEGLKPWTVLPVRLARFAPICPAPCPALQVLRLLITAWERRLIFTIGTSNTTGESDTVVWNEIHHKTEFGSNLTGHGYPDASYLDNVLAELTAQGVSEAVAKA